MEGKSVILSLEDIIIALFNLTSDEHAVVAKDSVLSLINLTAEEDGARKIFQIAKDIHPVNYPFYRAEGRHK